MEKRTDIFQYNDFTQFLKDWRNVDPKRTHAYICNKLGQQKTRSYFSRIVSGKKPVGPTILNKLIKLIGLKNDEAEYFRALVGYKQAKSEDKETRKFWFNVMMRILSNS